MASADATQTARKDLFQSTIYGGKTIVKYLIHEAHWPIAASPAQSAQRVPCPSRAHSDAKLVNTPHPNA